MGKVKSALKSYFSGFKFVPRVMLHPFKAFWELKHDGMARMSVSVTMIVMYILSKIIFQQFAAYSFNPMAVSPWNIDIIGLTIETLLILALWCASNWGLTTLFEGEGSGKDILHYTAYSLAPIIIITLVLTPLSHIMSADEAAIFSFVEGLATAWTGLLLFTGTMTTHQYGALRTLVTIFFIVCGMVLLVFIGLLFFFLLQQLVGLVYAIYREITMRY